MNAIFDNGLIYRKWFKNCLQSIKSCKRNGTDALDKSFYICRNTVIQPFRNTCSTLYFIPCSRNLEKLRTYVLQEYKSLKKLCQTVKQFTFLVSRAAKDVLGLHFPSFGIWHTVEQTRLLRSNRTIFISVVSSNQIRYRWRRVPAKMSTPD